MKKFYLFLPLAIAILIGAVFWVNEKGQELSQPVNFIEATQPVIMKNPELSKTPEEIAIVTEEATEDETLPTKHLNSLAFTSQAPYAKWDNLHDEACEEASIIMAHNYLIETEKIEIHDAENEIQKMVTFQKTYFGSHKDLTAKEMIELAQEFYSEEYQLIEFNAPAEISETPAIISENIVETEAESVPASEVEIPDKEASQIEINWEENIEYMKKELSEGSIFIIPAAGRELNNPYFRIPGPLYHALVIVGYDDNKQEFITHDPGTRRGENYRYSYKILWNAIRDFPGKKADILKGTKTVILVEKNSDLNQN